LSDPHTKSLETPRQADFDDPDRWGTVFMGPDKFRETRLDKILNQQERDLWNRGAEMDYMKRVREKAEAQAKSLLDQAVAANERKKNAVEEWAESVRTRNEQLHAEALQGRDEARDLIAQARTVAENAHKQGHETGYQAGLELARQEAEQRELQRDAAAAAVLRRIQEQCGVIFDSWREELSALLRSLVETAGGWVMQEEHALRLGQILDQSVQALQMRRHVVVSVNPGEVVMIKKLLTNAQDSLHIEGWSVRADSSVTAGGLVVESDAGRVENLIAMRRAIVDEALTKFSLPATGTDAAARAAVLEPLPELSVLPDPPERPGPDVPDADMPDSEMPDSEMPDSKDPPEAPAYAPVDFEEDAGGIDPADCGEEAGAASLESDAAQDLLSVEPLADAGEDAETASLEDDAARDAVADAGLERSDA
jgi:flagellar assembly protein FliH